MALLLLYDQSQVEPAVEKHSSCLEARWWQPHSVGMDVFPQQIQLTC